MASRFRIFLSPMSITPEKAEKVVLATCVLHNYLREKCSSRYTPHGALDQEILNKGQMQPGEWISLLTDSFQPLSLQSGNRSTLLAQAVREKFNLYFNGEGQVSWQDSFIA